MSNETVNNTTFQRWKEDFKISQLGWSGCAFGYFVLFSKQTIIWFNNILVTPFISTSPENSFYVNIVFTILLLTSIFYLRKHLKNKLLPSHSSIILALTVLIIYLFFFRFNTTYIFYKFWYQSIVSYTDVFFTSIILFVSAYKSYLPALSKPYSFLSLLDDSTNLSNHDSLSRNKYASEIAQHINATVCETSFAISVIGEWGAGKTDFMLRLKEALKKNGDNRIIDFNPWRVAKSEAIIEEFFKSLSSELKPYNRSIGAKIKDYSNRILQTGKEVQYKLIDTIIEELMPDKSLQKQYKAINDSIEATGKRFLIFIDDVDRLTGKEVMEVLRLIRNTASFANTFFVVGIDQKYIIEVLKKTSDFANESEYLKKVFQLTITLPAFKKDIFNPLVKYFLVTIDLSDDDKLKIENALNSFYLKNDSIFISDSMYTQQEDIFQEMLENIRDVKRFCNSFKIVFSILKDEVNIRDLIILELIRTRNIEIYNSIRSKDIFAYDIHHPDRFKLNDKALEEIESKKENGIFKKALSILIESREQNNSRSFSRIHNFYIYFSYQLFNLISLGDFTTLLQKNNNEIYDRFNEWINEGKENELSIIISTVNKYENIDILRNITIALMRLGDCDSKWLGLVNELVFRSWNSNHKGYFLLDKQLHKLFLLTLINEESISLISRAGLAHLFLDSIITTQFDESELFISKRDLNRLVYSLFSRYLLLTNKNYRELINFYYLNDYARYNGSYIEVYKPASRLLKKHLLTNPISLELYTRNIFSKYNPASGPMFTIESSLESIFPNANEFINHLKETNFKTEEMNHIKAIAIKCLEKFYLNNKAEPFFIEEKYDNNFIQSIIAFNTKL